MAADSGIILFRRILIGVALVGVGAMVMGIAINHEARPTVVVAANDGSVPTSSYNSSMAYHTCSHFGAKVANMRSTAVCTKALPNGTCVAYGEHTEAQCTNGATLTFTTTAND